MSILDLHWKCIAPSVSVCRDHIQKMGAKLSELTTVFNDLITEVIEWKSKYDKVEDYVLGYLDTVLKLEIFPDNETAVEFLQKIYTNKLKLGSGPDFEDLFPRIFWDDTDWECRKNDAMKHKLALEIVDGRLAWNHVFKLLTHFIKPELKWVNTTEFLPKFSNALKIILSYKWSDPRLITNIHFRLKQCKSEHLVKSLSGADVVDSNSFNIDPDTLDAIREIQQELKIWAIEHDWVRDLLKLFYKGDVTRLKKLRAELWDIDRKQFAIVLDYIDLYIEIYNDKDSNNIAKYYELSNENKILNKYIDLYELISKQIESWLIKYTFISEKLHSIFWSLTEKKAANIHEQNQIVSESRKCEQWVYNVKMRKYKQFNEYEKSFNSFVSVLLKDKISGHINSSNTNFYTWWDALWEKLLLDPSFLIDWFKNEIPQDPHCLNHVNLLHRSIERHLISNWNWSPEFIEIFLVKLKTELLWNEAQRMALRLKHFDVPSFKQVIELEFQIKNLATRVLVHQFSDMQNKSNRPIFEENDKFFKVFHRILTRLFWTSFNSIDWNFAKEVKRLYEIREECRKWLITDWEKFYSNKEINTIVISLILKMENLLLGKGSGRNFKDFLEQRFIAEYWLDDADETREKEWYFSKLADLKSKTSSTMWHLVKLLSEAKDIDWRKKDILVSVIIEKLKNNYNFKTWELEAIWRLLIENFSELIKKEEEAILVIRKKYTKRFLTRWKDEINPTTWEIESWFYSDSGITALLNTALINIYNCFSNNDLVISEDELKDQLKFSLKRKNIDNLWKKLNEILFTNVKQLEMDRLLRSEQLSSAQTELVQEENSVLSQTDDEISSWFFWFLSMATNWLKRFVTNAPPEEESWVKEKSIDNGNLSPIEEVVSYRIKEEYDEKWAVIKKIRIYSPDDQLELDKLKETEKEWIVVRDLLRWFIDEFDNAKNNFLTNKSTVKLSNIVRRINSVFWTNHSSFNSLAKEMIIHSRKKPDLEPPSLLVQSAIYALIEAQEKIFPKWADLTSLQFVWYTTFSDKENFYYAWPANYWSYKYYGKQSSLRLFHNKGVEDDRFNYRIEILNSRTNKGQVIITATDRFSEQDKHDFAEVRK